MLQSIFLNILKSALAGEKSEKLSLSHKEREALFTLSDSHKLLPLVFDCVHPHTEDFAPVRQQVKLMVSQQVLRTLAFEKVYAELISRGLSPVVVKGIICRSLYPNPDLRISSDEDLLISPKEFPLCEKALTSMGFVKDKNSTQPHYQTTFTRNDGLRLEIHTSLFDVSDPFFKKWNEIFENFTDKTLQIKAGNAEFLTLAPTEHLIYLILHALKHFIHSGVGIRQVCDILMFAERSADAICWDKVISILGELNALKFTVGIFAIGKKHLVPHFEAAHIFLGDSLSTSDNDKLLQDILDAGIYGSSTMSRRHSSSITLSGAKGEKKSLIPKVFPPAKSLNKRYSYAKDKPFLLPVAWGHRLINYKKEISHTENNTPRQAVRIGNARLELLKEYGLIPEK